MSQSVSFKADTYHAVACGQPNLYLNNSPIIYISVRPVFKIIKDFSLQSTPTKTQMPLATQKRYTYIGYTLKAAKLAATNNTTVPDQANV